MNNLLKKYNKVQLFRHSFQILMLFLSPFLFSLCLNGIKTMVSMLSKSDNVTLSPVVLSSITILMLTMVFGRFFCGWFCLFGAYCDGVYGIFGRFTKKITLKLIKHDKYLKLIKYLLLVFIIILCINGQQQWLGDKDVWVVFSQIFLLKLKFNGMAIGVCFFLFVTAGCAVIERFYCRYLCPLGAALSIADRLKIFRISKPSEKCGSCPRCTGSCPMGIKLSGKDEITSSECIKCMKCLDVCPRKNMSFKGYTLNLKLVPSIVFILLVIFGLYQYNGII